MKNKLVRAAALALCLSFPFAAGGCSIMSPKSDARACESFANQIKEEAKKYGDKRPNSLKEATEMLSQLAEPARRAAGEASSDDLAKAFEGLSESLSADFAKNPEKVLSLGFQMESVTQQCKEVGVDFSKIK
ncbi:hypothetical protein ACUH9Y_06025 [Dermabacteraceae bacterium P13115]